MPTRTAAALILVGMCFGAFIPNDAVAAPHAPRCSPQLETRYRRAGTTPVAVPGDRRVAAAFGPDASDWAIVYLHGWCGDPFAFRSWFGAATKHGTLIGLRGDVTCSNPRRSRWSWHHAAQHRRIQAAIAAVDAARRRVRPDAIPLRRVALIGYSQGSKRVESLAAAYPKRYRHVVLLSQVDEPTARRLPGVRAVALLSGDQDAARHHMKRGAARLARAGRRARYFELPNAKHGQYGPRGKNVMTRALDFLFAPTATAGSSTALR